MDPEATHLQGALVESRVGADCRGRQGTRFRRTRTPASYPASGWQQRWPRQQAGSGVGGQQEKGGAGASTTGLKGEQRKGNSGQDFCLFIKSMSTCSTSSALRETQIKTAMSSHFTPARTAVTENTDTNTRWRGHMEKLEPPGTAGGNGKQRSYCGIQRLGLNTKMLQKVKQSYHVTQQFHSRVYT